jgi:hypothetical protein
MFHTVPHDYWRPRSTSKTHNTIPDSLDDRLSNRGGGGDSPCLTVITTTGHLIAPPLYLHDMTTVASQRIKWAAGWMAGPWPTLCMRTLTEWSLCLHATWKPSASNGRNTYKVPKAWHPSYWVSPTLFTFFPNPLWWLPWTIKERHFGQEKGFPHTHYCRNHSKSCN